MESVNEHYYKALEKFACSEVLLILPIHPQGLELEVRVRPVIAGLKDLQRTARV